MNITRIPRNILASFLTILILGFSIGVGVGVGFKILPSGSSEELYEEVKIDTEALISICDNKKNYEINLNKDGHDLTKYKISAIELKLSTDKPRVYKVFRWTCQYKLTSIKLPNPIPSRPGVQPSPILIGLDLDKYCQEKFKDKGLIKASYHEYNDPDSWYCVNPNF